MVGDIIELLVIMLVIATLAYAPLGYYIHCYTRGSGKPFGDTTPHGDSPSLVNNFAEAVIHLIKSKLSKK